MITSTIGMTWALAWSLPMSSVSHWTAVAWRSPQGWVDALWPTSLMFPKGSYYTGFCLFFLIKHQKWYFSQGDLRSYYVCKRPRRHCFQELEIILSRGADSHMTISRLRWHINTFTNDKRNRVCGLRKSSVRRYLVLCLVAQSCPTLCDPKDCSRPIPHSSRLLCPWGFSRQEYWSGLPCPPPGDLPNAGMEPSSPALQADS